MKLHELMKEARRHSGYSETLEVEPAGGIYGEFKVVVEFDYEGESYTQHEPDNSSFREHHPASIDINSITLGEDVDEYDEDGEKTGKVFKKGTEADKLPGWDKSDDEYVLDKLYDKVGTPDDDDYDPPDDYDYDR